MYSKRKKWQRDLFNVYFVGLGFYFLQTWLERAETPNSNYLGPI